MPNPKTSVCKLTSFKVMACIRKSQCAQLRSQHMRIWSYMQNLKSPHTVLQILTYQMTEPIQTQADSVNRLEWSYLVHFPANHHPPCFKSCPSFSGRPSITRPVTEITCFLYSGPPSLYCGAAGWSYTQLKSMCGVLLLEFPTLIGRFPEGSVRIVDVDWLK